MQNLQDEKRYSQTAASFKNRKWLAEVHNFLWHILFSRDAEKVFQICCANKQS